MKIQILSTTSLHLLHNSITQAMATDDAHPDSEKPYGVRRYWDWRLQADDIEAELVRRGQGFVPLAW